MRPISKFFLFFAAISLAAIAIAAPVFAQTMHNAPEKTPLLIGFGDSLMAGYGLAEAKSFPSKLQAALDKQNISLKIVNQGISGDTTHDGLARLDWVLKDEPNMVILELGANDALRGLSPALVEQNLNQILAKLTNHRRPDGSKITVILAGMKAPRNLGADYVGKFDAIYPRLAKKYRLIFYPFFLDGVALNPQFLQTDGLHPNEKGVDLMVGRFLPVIEKAREHWVRQNKTISQAR